MSAEATSTATPPTTAPPPSAMPSGAPPVAAGAPPEVAAGVPASSPEFEAYRTATDKRIADMQAQLAASAPKPAPQEYTSRAHTAAVEKFGADADPALLATWESHTRAINALDYQIANESDPTKRATLIKSIGEHSGRQASTRASILMLQREAQRAREQSQESAPKKAQPEATSLASIPMATLQDQAKVTPALEADCPLVAASLRSGAIKYDDLLARISDPANNPAAQWNSIMSAVENQLATGTFVATPAPANGVTPPAAAPLVAGMPPANGGQSSMPKPATTESERKAADAAHVARMRAAH